jgi:hypothetical protein
MPWQLVDAAWSPTFFLVSVSAGDGHAEADGSLVGELFDARPPAAGAAVPS